MTDAVTSPPAGHRPMPLLRPAPRVIVSDNGSVVGVFARGFARAAVRKQGGEVISALPALVAEQRGVRFDPAQLDAYRQICGYPPAPLDAPVPPTWPETRFLRPLAALVSHPELPLSPLGLIHVGQTITALAPIAGDDEVDLRCELLAARRIGRGVELDIGLWLHVHGVPRWRGAVTFLSRNAATRARARRGGKPHPGSAASHRGPPPPGRTDPLADWSSTLELQIAANTGRRYARASDDHNPHHLWPLTARLLGYPRPIAHGMWTLARCLAAIEAEAPLPPRLHIEARFGKPLYLPGRAVFGWLRGERAGGFGVHRPRDGKRHLHGGWAALEPQDPGPPAGAVASVGTLPGGEP